MLYEVQHRDAGRLALALGVVAAGSAACLATYHAVLETEIAAYRSAYARAMGDSRRRKSGGTSLDRLRYHTPREYPIVRREVRSWVTRTTIKRTRRRCLPAATSITPPGAITSTPATRWRGARLSSPAPRGRITIAQIGQQTLSVFGMSI